MHVVGLSRGVLPTRGTLDGTRPAKTCGIAPCLRATAEDACVRHVPGAIAGIGACLRSDWLRQCDLHERRHRNSAARRTCVKHGGALKRPAQIRADQILIDGVRLPSKSFRETPRINCKPNGWRMDPAWWRRWRRGTSDVARRRAHSNCHRLRSWRHNAQ